MKEHCNRGLLLLILQFVVLIKCSSNQSGYRGPGNQGPGNQGPGNQGSGNQGTDYQSSPVTGKKALKWFLCERLFFDPLFDCTW